MPIAPDAPPAAGLPLEHPDLSLTGKRWMIQQEGRNHGIELAQTLGTPEIIGRILANRGLHPKALEDALDFMSPSLQTLKDPDHFLDMGVCVERVYEALQEGEKLAVFGDYDVDGSCSAALLVRYFKLLGSEPILYIPDRMSEGYGPNPKAMQRLKDQGAQVVITVDCGCVAFEAMEEARSLGLDVILTDHHKATPQKPACVGHINPNRVDEDTPYTMLCGAGIAFYLCMALNRYLRKIGYFTETLTEPKLASLLDLVAVATICDMVPLVGPNRALVRRGLQVLEKNPTPGLAALLRASGWERSQDGETIQPSTIGFGIGPRINAGGRIGECDTGARLLSSDDTQEINRLAARLDMLNEERRTMEQEACDEAFAQATRQMMGGEAQKNQTPPTALVLHHEHWHPGVVGIVASRIVRKFHRPVFVLAVDKTTQEAKGSGRSVDGIDIGACVLNMKEEDGLLISGGGHGMAAGVTLPSKNIAAFTRHLQEMVAAQAEAFMTNRAVDVFTPCVKLDGYLLPESATPALLDTLDKLQPYGQHNPEPLFAFKNVRIPYAKAVGADGSHVSFTLRGASGATLKGIAFRAMETGLGPALLARDARLSLAGTLSRNRWQGRESVQLMVSDAWMG